MKPGVYIMRDKDGTVIYVGKAKLLKNRVSSYFHGAHNAKTEAMISKIADFSVIIADSEFEALVLENSLIKHHSPHYNILLKDDKGYPFIRLDYGKPYPRFSVASRRADDGAEYYGPYGGRGATFSAIDSISKMLKLPDCTRKFPRDVGKERPCLNFQMGQCDGYCLPEVPKEKYDEAIEKARLILKGKSRELIEQLKEEMEELASELKFEEAAAKRDIINSIRSLETKQHVLLKGSSDTDAVGFFRGETKSCFNVLHYIQGQLLGKDSQLLEDPVEDTSEALSLLIRQYYLSQNTVPRNVVLTEDTGDTEELSRFLSELSGHAVSVTVPQRGMKRDYTEAAIRNAEEETKRLTTKQERVSKTAQWLMEALKLPSPPARVEAFDISNTGASDIVASMVVFKDGKPLKRDYRKFKIKTLEKESPDDYASMREVVGRRLERYKNGDEKFSPLPDLMLIDGGARHTACALEAMEKAGVFCPVFGMVKDDRHRTRALITADGEEISISHLPSVFSFIGNIQEEVHRFAITFHRESHIKSAKKSVLDGIPGIGEKRKNELYRAFKSLKNIENASLEELSHVIPRNAASEVYAKLHGEEEKK